MKDKEDEDEVGRQRDDHRRPDIKNQKNQRSELETAPNNMRGMIGRRRGTQSIQCNRKEAIKRSQLDDRKETLTFRRRIEVASGPHESPQHKKPEESKSRLLPRYCG